MAIAQYIFTTKCYSMLKNQQAITPFELNKCKYLNEYIFANWFYGNLEMILLTELTSQSDKELPTYVN